MFALTYNYNTPPYGQTPPIATGANIAAILIGIAFVTAVLAIAIMALWKIFTKAGRPGWASLIPFYNTWVLNEVAGKPGWWVLFSLIPFVGWLIFVVFYIIVCIELAKRFGKDPWFAVLLIIPPLPIIGFSILAFGKAQYQGNNPATPQDQPPAAPVPHTDTDSDTNSPVQTVGNTQPPTPPQRQRRPRPPRGLIQ